MTPILGIIASSISGSISNNSFESIATVTVGSGGTSEVTFSSIPSTYTHLQIRWLARGSSSGSDQGSLAIRVGNGSVDTGSNYARHALEGNGASASSGASTSQTYATIANIPRNTYDSGMFGAGVVDVLDYANGNKYKTFRTLGGNDTNNTGTEKGIVSLYSGLWMSTSAINTIKFSVSGFTQSLAQYSHFALYGIKS
jgi:hypothetical protein